MDGSVTVPRMEGWEYAASVPPAPLPPGWMLVQDGGDGCSYRHRDGLAVIVSACRERDGKRWLHVSFSRAMRVPDYRDVKTVKRVFVGDDRVAVQVFPRASDHVNLHPYCLHLWCCLDGHPLPDFTHGSGSI